MLIVKIKCYNLYCESGNLKKCFLELLLRQEYKTIDYKKGEQECQARALVLQQGCLDLLTIFTRNGSGG